MLLMLIIAAVFPQISRLPRLMMSASKLNAPCQNLYNIISNIMWEWMDGLDGIGWLSLVIGLLRATLVLIIAAVFPQDIPVAKAHDERLKFAHLVSKLIQLI